MLQRCVYSDCITKFSKQMSTIVSNLYKNRVFLPFCANVLVTGLLSARFRTIEEPNRDRVIGEIALHATIFTIFTFSNSFTNFGLIDTAVNASQRTETQPLC